MGGFEGSNPINAFSKSICVAFEVEMKESSFPVIFTVRDLIQDVYEL